MGFLTDANVGTDLFSLQDFEPTSAQSMGATIQETISGNPSSVLWNLADLNSLNNNGRPKMSRVDAEELVKQSGVSGLQLGDGEYTQEALNMLIERRRKAMIRADVMSRTEFSAIGTPVRGAAMLGTAILDPLNIAAAFVPVVGQARVASMLGNTAAGSLARAGARARIGMIEGTVGTAMLEPLIMYGRDQLQDDYDMSDALLNIAFGGAFGGGLHAGVGRLADALRSSDPYARFSGLSPEQVRTVLDFEKTVTPDMTPADIEKAISAWTPRMRDAAGFARSDASMPLAGGARASDTFDPARYELPEGLTKEDFRKLYEAYPAEVTQAIAQRVASRHGSDLPFAKLADATPESASQMAARELAGTLRADALAIAGNRSAPGEIAALRAEAELLGQQIEANQQQFKALAKQFQQEGLSRKRAEAKAARVQGDNGAELNGRRAALEQQIDMNRRAAEAEQDIAALNRGEIPARYQERVRQRADEILGHAAIARAVAPPARDVISGLLPETRQAMFRAAVAQALEGRLPDVDLLARADPANQGFRPTIDEFRAAAERQASADSLAVGSRTASLAASKRLAEAPKDASVAAAEQELGKAVERMNQLRQNLEDGGMDKMRLDIIMEEMRPFDKAVNDADAYGNAVRAAALCGLRA